MCLSALVQLEVGFDRLACAVADDDVARLRKTDEPRRRCYWSAHRQRTGPTEDHVAALERHPQRDRLAEHARQSILRRERGPCGLGCMIGLVEGGRCSERCEQGADETLLYRPSSRLDFGRGLGVETIKQDCRLLRVLVRLVRRLHGSEEDCDTLTLERGRLRSRLGKVG